jgi:diguanylate cyclase (GGDEF)-like protein
MLEAKRHDEEGRLAALARYQVLDTPAEAPFEKITSLVQSVLGVPICAVSLVDRERQWFKSIQGLDARETPRSISFCTHTIKTDQTLVVADALEDPRFATNPLVLGEPHIRSYAGVPLQTPDGYNVGALCAIDVAPRDYSEAQLGILRSFASLVVDELELRRIAERDHLTHALTRRGFVEQMKKEIARYHRHARESVLVMMDVDHFKSVNDRFGHPAGDEVLKAIAAACLKNLRENDAFGRLGGEEFGILLTDTDAGGGLDAAEKIRRTIEALLIDVAGGLRVTSSFGLASLTPAMTGPEGWIAAADEALYSAKRGGRNRCVAAGAALSDPIAA